MKKQTLILITIAALLLGILILTAPSQVYAGALPQSALNTPTPNDAGQILYTVVEGDNCTRVFLLFDVPIDQIIQLNDLDEECSISPGQQLLIAVVDPATATPEGPVQTPTAGPPTPTTFPGFAEVCVVLYEDLDGNQKRSASEFYLAGGVISMNNRSGTFSETLNTVGGDPSLVDPVCFENVPEDEYNLSMGIPEGYNPTTSMNYALKVNAGDTIVVDFGAQPSSRVIDDDPSSGGNRSPLLLAIGLFLLAGGAGLAFFFIRSRQG